MTTGCKVTLYATILNEIESIDRLLESLKSQTRQSDEFILVDGGSTDGTIERIVAIQKSYPNLRLIQYPGSSPAEGRNKGFATASYDLVASIDGGCYAKNDWLECLLREMHPDVDIVSGVYLPDSRTRFERCVGDMTFPDIESLPENWNSPSHRSVMIRKHVWTAIGGYPPSLGPSEDTWFNLEATRRGFKFRIAREAIVFWRPRRNLVELFKNSFRWMMSDARYNIGMERLPKRMFIHIMGDALALVGWCNALVTTVAISPILGVFGLVASTILIARPLRTIHIFRSEKSIRNKITKNLIILTSSAAMLAGYLLGTLMRMHRTQLPATISTT